ncbi:MAG: glycosyltransferase family 4 protein [Candidatus Micrarchaeota archaeon]
MRIAFFNWRDIRNPAAGGAEVYVHQIMKRLAARGHSVALFTSSYPGAKAQESIDGIRHVRYGGRFLIYPKALLCYRKYVQGRFDAIIESINGPPFFTALFAKEPVFPLIHQLTRENWYSGISLPLAFAGYHLEDPMLRLYRGRTAIAPSPSTRSDLLRLGFRDVRVVHGAPDVEPAAGPKETAPTLLYIGRLTRSKRVDHALSALRLIRERVPGARLWVAGSGPEEERLRKSAREDGLEGSVEFFGKVSQQKKAELMSKAHLMLFPAVREGWGLVVLECNACSTPVIGYDVPGLRDSIRDGINGALVPDGDYARMAEAAVALLDDRGRLRGLSASSAAFAGGFSWENAAEEAESILEEALREK